LEVKVQDPGNPICYTCNSFVASRPRFATWNYSLQIPKFLHTHIRTCLFKMVDS